MAGNKTLDIKSLDKGHFTGLQFMVVFEVSSQTLLLLVKEREFSLSVKKRRKTFVISMSILIVQGVKKKHLKHLVQLIKTFVVSNSGLRKVNTQS